jgi:hypothetical protein
MRTRQLGGGIHAEISAPVSAFHRRMLLSTPVDASQIPSRPPSARLR